MGIVANREREAGDAVSFGAISKDTNRRPDQDMIEALTDLRESGQVLSSWIADETRSLDNFVGSPTVREWMLEVLPVARLDPWAGKAFCAALPISIVFRARRPMASARDSCT